MRFPLRTSAPPEAPGVVGTARVGRRASALAPRLRPGDVAVLDHVDLDRAGAQLLVDRGVVAVVDASPLISGRYPNLGPEVLARAGIVLVDGIGQTGLAAIGDGRSVRVHDGSVFRGDLAVATGRVLDAETVAAEMDAARAGLAHQLEVLTRSSTELVRREQDLLLHGTAVPRPATKLAGRSAVVVVEGPGYAAELAGIRTYLREQEPVVIGVGRVADELRRRGHHPAIVVIDGDDDQDRPAAATLKAARDVVVRSTPGRPAPTDGLARLGVRPLVVETTLLPEDVALLLAEAGEAAMVVGVGLHATLDDFLDRDRGGLASTYLTRLRLGPRLVDAQAVPRLYAGRVRPYHLLLVMLAGLLALAVAVGVTPVGQEWLHEARSFLEGLSR